MKTSVQVKGLLLGCLLISLMSGCAVPEAPATEPAASAEPTEIPSPTPLVIQMPVKLTWNKLADIPTPRFAHATSIVDGKIYVIGGWGALTTVEMYDPTTGSWTRKADMLTGRLWVSSSVVDGKIYAIGGSSGPDYLSPSLATVEMYDPATDTWTQKAAMPTARSNMATVVVDGNIFALGGWVIDQGGPSKAVEVYNPATDTWITHTEMLDAMQPGAGLLDGKIYATDGSYLEVYDPTTESWSKFKGIPDGTMFASVCPLGNLLFAFGGAHVGGSGARLADIYVYDPSTDIWEKLPDDMPFKGWLMSASEGDGKIYIIGGSNQDWEVYAYADPESSDNPPPMSGVWEVTIES